MLIVITICAFAVIIIVVLSLVCADAMRKRAKRKNNEMTQSSVEAGIKSGIASRLHAICNGSKWRWVCKPLNFATNGGIARIEAIYASGERCFIDVCYDAVDGYMALHVTDAVELAIAETVLPVAADEAPTLTESAPAIRPDDEESVAKWFKIVLIGALTDLIGELHANGEASLHIGHDGKAYIENGSGRRIVHEFGNLPDNSLWGNIVDKLSESGLYAEIQGSDSIFISWC